MFCHVHILFYYELSFRKCIKFYCRINNRCSGPKREEVTGQQKELHSEELNDLYSSPNIQVIISRRMRLDGHVARMGEGKRCIRCFGREI
jgi:hypothetical protein